MLVRALYLRKAIDQFIADGSDSEGDIYRKYKLSKTEWEQAEILVTILYPFKRASTKLEATSKPGIDVTFWAYECLFNKMDDLKKSLTQRKEPWASGLLTGLFHMRAKLSKYYGMTTKPFVYPFACLLDPSCKQLLFEQKTFEKKYKKQYTDACRKYFETHYMPRVQQADPKGKTKKRKRPTDETAVFKLPKEPTEDAEDPYDIHYTLKKMNESRPEENEFDIYLRVPTIRSKNPLEYYRSTGSHFPGLKLMVRDIFTVTATGAGVEREFSKSGRVATWTRSRLNPKTISETMIVKSYFERKEELGKIEDEDGEEEYSEVDLNDSFESEELKHLHSLEEEFLG
jgi:hAT family C-terminal dimerisation region